MDAKRIEEKRNGIIPCIVHENHVTKIVDPNKALSTKLIDRLYSKIVLTLPGKFIIILITIITASAGSVGSYRLEQWFDPIWFLPKGTHLNDYIAARHQYFSQKGHSAYVFIGNIDYPSEFSKIMTLTSNLKNLSSVEKIESWPDHFANFVKKFYQAGKSEEYLIINYFFSFYNDFLKYDSCDKHFFFFFRFNEGRYKTGRFSTIFIEISLQSSGWKISNEFSFQRKTQMWGKRATNFNRYYRIFL